MKIQKFRHACLELVKDGVSLVIDPGEWSTDFEPNKHIVGVVITHEHSDHFDKDQLQQIIAKNPAVRIVAHTDIITQLDDIVAEKQPVAVGETVTVGPFQLQFTGGTHATIHLDYPVPTNLGVIVNDGELYYPGDSFVVPDCRVKTLAVPASAPWMKIAEAMDFITTVKPKVCFPTHNALLSTEGQQLANAWLEKAVVSVSATYTVL